MPSWTSAAAILAKETPTRLASVACFTSCALLDARRRLLFAWSACLYVWSGGKNGKCSGTDSSLLLLAKPNPPDEDSGTKPPLRLLDGNLGTDNWNGCNHTLDLLLDGVVVVANDDDVAVVVSLDDLVNERDDGEFSE